MTRTRRVLLDPSVFSTHALNKQRENEKKDDPQQTREEGQAVPARGNTRKDNHGPK